MGMGLGCTAAERERTAQGSSIVLKEVAGESVWVEPYAACIIARSAALWSQLCC